MGLSDFIKSTTPTPGDDGGKKPTQGGLSGFLDTDEGKQGLPGVTEMSAPTNVDVSAYAPWLKNGVNPGQDIDYLRAKNQSIWEQMGKGVVNLVPNIVGSTIENLGYLGTIGQFGEDRDYTNWIVKAGQAMKDPAGEVFREHPDQTFDLKDPAWWGQIFSGTVDAAASFAMEGAGLAKLFGRLGEGMKMLGMGARAAKIGAEGLSAMTMAYGMGAQAGASVFDASYQHQLQKGIDSGMSYDDAKEQAKQIASNAAATTVQLNTALNTLLMVPTIAPLFKTTDDIMNWWKTEGMKKAEESWSDWATRIKTATPDKLDAIKALVDPRSNGYTHYASSAAAMAAQGLVNDFAVARGRAIGEGKSPEVQNFSGLLDTFGHFFDDTMNSQGALDVITGAAAGFMQPLILDRVPMHKVAVDSEGKISNHQFDGAETPDGKYQTKLVSTKYLNSVGMRDYFTNVKDQVVKDIQRVTEHRDAIAKAAASGDMLEAERLKRHLFDVGALNSVQLGMGENFAEQFKQIGATDNTKLLAEPLMQQVSQINEQIAQETDQQKKQALSEQRDGLMDQIKKLGDATDATQKGYAKDKNDNEYKQKAEKAVHEIKEYTQLWDDIYKKHGLHGDEFDSRYADFLFGHEIDARRRKSIIEEEEKRIREQEARRNMAMHPDEDPVTTQAIADIQEHTTLKDNLNAEEGRIRRSLATLSGKDEAAKEPARKHLRELAAKYGVTVGTDDDLIPGAHQILEGIKDKQDEITGKSARSIDSVQASEGYQKWKEKNPDPKKNIVDYIKATNRRTREDEEIAKDKQNLNQFRTQSEIASRNLKDLRTSKGKNRFVKQAKQTHNAIVKQLKSQIDRNNATAIDQAFDKKNTAQLSTIQRDHYRSVIESNKKGLVDEKSKLETRQKEIAQQLHELLQGGFLKRLKNKLEYAKLKKELDSNHDRIQSLTKAIESADQHLADLGNPLVPDGAVLPNPVPTVTPPPAGLEEQGKPVPGTHTDADMAQFLGSTKAHDDLLDSIWGMKKTGTEAEMLPHAMQSMGDIMHSMDHDFLHLTPEEQEKYRPFMESYLKDKLHEAGKIKEKEAAPTNLEEAVLHEVAKLPIPESEKADLLTALSQYEELLKQGGATHNTDLVVGYVKDNFGLSTEDALRVVHAFEKQLGSSTETAAEVSTTAASATEEVQPQKPTKEDIEARRQAELAAIHVDPITETKSTTRPLTKDEERAAVRKLMVPGSKFKLNGQEVTVEKYAKDGFKIVDSDGNLMSGMLYPHGVAEDHVADQLSYILLQNGMGEVTTHETSSRDNTDELERRKAEINSKYDRELNEQVEASADATKTEDAAKAAEEEEIAESNKGENDVPSIDQIAEPLPPDTNIGQPMPIDIRTFSITDGSMQHGGAKAETAIKANVLTHEYFDEITEAVMPDAADRTGNVYVGQPGSGVYTKRDRFSLNPNLNPLYVRPGYIQAGTELKLVIDTAFDGHINDDGQYVYGGPAQKKDAFSNYADENGKVKTSDEHIGNVPIKIVDPRTGKTVAYLPRTDWVNAKYAGTGPTDYRNIVDEKAATDTNPGYSNNVEKQTKELLELRRKLVVAHNMGYTDGLPTTVRQRGRGMALREEPGRAHEMLPDPSLRMALVQGVSARTAAGETLEGVVLPEYMMAGENAGRYNNIPGVLLPDAAGRLNFEPLWTDRNGKGQIDTVVRAIEIYLTHQSSASVDAQDRAARHAKDIEDATGFNVTTTDGLQNFINQYYYYTRWFNDQNINANPRAMAPGTSAAPRIPEFMLGVGFEGTQGERATVKAGVSFLNRVSSASVDVNGRINEDFRQLLEDEGVGLASRFRNVVYARPERNLRGINSAGPISEVTFRPDSDDFATTQHASYNDMIKRYSQTTMHGKLQSSDGSYIYYAHPITELNKEDTMAVPLVPKRRVRTKGPEAEVPKEEVKPQGLSDADKQRLIDLDTGVDFEPKVNISEERYASSVGEVKGKPADLDSLRNLRNFTENEHWNGKTPEEVLQEMDRLGIRTLPEGYNPFYSC